MINKNKEDIIKLFVTDNGKILNDHYEGLSCGCESTACAIVEFVGESRRLALIENITTAYQSLNEAYIGSDNKVHLGRTSVGGVLKNKPNLNDAIREYNDNKYMSEGRKIKRLYFPDGSILEVK